jgi:hypothetical protein
MEGPPLKQYHNTRRNDHETRTRKLGRKEVMMVPTLQVYTSMCYRKLTEQYRLTTDPEGEHCVITVIGMSGC